MTASDQTAPQDVPGLTDGGWRVHGSPFNRDALTTWEAEDARLANWPAVYVLDGPGNAVYIGETLHATSRMQQHLANPDRAGLTRVRVVLDPTFNKSATLDFESRLIQWVHADGRFDVGNRNAGIVDADYHARDWYRERFTLIAESLKDYTGGSLLSSTVAQLQNSDLYKLSPFKTPTTDQYLALEHIVETLLRHAQDDAGQLLVTGERPPSHEPFVVQGDAGTGKTIVAIYLIKLLTDIARHGGDERPVDTTDETRGLEAFYTQGNQDLLKGFRIGFVIPQQSLRESVRRVFSQTAGLSASMVLAPLEVGEAEEDYDLLVVDEAHRLSRYAAQSMGTITRRFKDAHARMFGAEDRQRTQLDWVRARSRFQLFLVDPEQAVRTSDVPREVLEEMVSEAKSHKRYFPLATQMRVRGGSDYVREVKRVLAGGRPAMTTFSEYDFKVFRDPAAMYEQIRAREAEHGLARMLAGYAWAWASKGLRPGQEPQVQDIVVGGLSMRWNSTAKDWIASANSLNEVGSIHTVQGYDLNYAGVLIGGDLRYDADRGVTVFDRSSYRDKAASRNNNMLGATFSDDDLLAYVRNIYAVLMTRGMRGTYVHAVDAPLQQRLMELFPDAVV